MNISKLTITDIERKIERLHDRISTLNNIIKEVKDPEAKETLHNHLHKYKESLSELKEELTSRLPMQD